MNNRRGVAATIVVLSLCASSALGGDRDLLVASPAGTGVMRFDHPSGAGLGTFLDGLPGANYVTTGPDGNLYVTDLAVNGVLKFDGASGAYLGVFIAAGEGGLDGPQGLAFDPDGNLWVGSTFPPRIHRFNGQTGAYIDTPIGVGLLVPGGLAITSDWLVYSVCTPCQKVQRYNAVTQQSIVFLDHFSIAHPYGLTVGPEGDIFVTCTDDVDSVKRFSPDAVLVSEYTSPLLDDPFDVKIGPDRRVYVSATATSNIVLFDYESAADLGQFAALGRGEPARGIAFTVDQCPADFDADGFVTGLDFDAFVVAFEEGAWNADFDHDGFVTGLDFDAFVVAYETGC